MYEKKYFTIICIIICVFSLVSCGKKYECSMCKKMFKGEPAGTYTVGNMEIKFCDACDDAFGSYYGVVVDFFD